MGAWIETFVGDAANRGLAESHPTWVRGLKPYNAAKHKQHEESHPTWVRGLKQYYFVSFQSLWVAPYVGAWIET